MWAQMMKRKVVSLDFLSMTGTYSNSIAIQDKIIHKTLYSQLDSHLCACTSTGDLSYTSLNSKKSETKTILELGPNIEIMRAHPTQSHIFAIGGKERDLCIYDIEAIVKSKKECEETDAAGPNKDTLHKKKSTRNVGLIFQAKNVKNDFLDLQQPVWIHDLQFVNKEATKIAVATHYHQVGFLCVSI